MNLENPQNLALLIDHTLLKPDSAKEDILRLCSEAKQYVFASVCIHPYWVRLAADEIASSTVHVCTVVGFPLGLNQPRIKLAEAEIALADGATELDMVINVGALRSRDYHAVYKEIADLAEAAHASSAILKVILETSLLTEEEKITSARLAKEAKADFVKTSTGFSSGGATVEDVALLRKTVGENIGVKASGGSSHACCPSANGRCRRDPHRYQFRGRHPARTKCNRRVSSRYFAGSHGPLLMAVPKKSDVRFRERAELLDFLLEISTITAETLDLDRLLTRIAGIIHDVVPHELFAILLYNERTRGLRMRYSIGHRDEVAKNLIIRLGEGITGTAASGRQPVLVSDVRTDPRYLNALDAVRAELAVPMLVRGKLVGVIDLQATRLEAFSEQDKSLLVLIASRVAVAIDNARLYRRVERQNRHSARFGSFVAGVQLHP